MKKRLFTLIMLASMLVTACSGENAVTEQTGTASAVGTETAEAPTLLDTLPDGIDYGGAAYGILTTDYWFTEYNSTLNADVENGDTLNDAAYRVNTFVEEQYNVDVVYHYGKDFSIVSDVRASVMAGDNTYQYLAFGSAWDNCVSLITDGALYNLMDIPELDLKSEGFYTEANENYIINDRLYFAFSNYANAGGLPLYMVFNIDLLKQFDLPLPYDTILSGDWTMDVFEQYIKGVSADINGDGKIDGFDRHGFASGDKISNYCVFGYDVHVVERTEDSSYIPAIMKEEFVVRAQKWLDFKHNNSDVFIHSSVKGDTEAEHMFLLGNTLFAHTGSGLSDTNMRAIDTFDFGVAPFPKYDAAQDGYGNYLALNQFGIPSSVADPSMAATVAHGLAIASKVIMEPSYLDVFLDTKLLRDEESVQIIQMMKDDPIIDVARYYDFHGDTITPVYLLSSTNDPGKIVSDFEKVEKRAAAKAADFFSVFFEQ